MNNETALYAALASVPVLLGAGNLLRLSMARRMIDAALEPYQDKIAEYGGVEIPRIVPHSAAVEKARDAFVEELHTSDARINNARTYKIPFDKEPGDLGNVAEFGDYIARMLKEIKLSYPSALAAGVAVDVATDAILNEALLRAFPDSAKQAGVGELSDIMLGEHLKHFVDETGIIDLTAAFLTDVADILGESVVVTAVETLADADVAIFSLATIATREAKLINAGHSTPEESLKYGILDYGGRLAGMIGGAKLGGILGLKAGTVLNPGGGTAAGGLIGSVVGGISGVFAAKKIWREALVNEINTFKDQYRLSAHQAKKTMIAGIKDLAKRMSAVVRTSFSGYENVLKTHPDFRGNEKLAALTENLVTVYSADIQTVFAAIDKGRDDVMETIKAGPQPNLWQRLMGANWIRAAEKSLGVIVTEKKKYYQPVLYSYNGRQRAHRPAESLQYFAKIGFIEGGQSAVMADRFAEEIKSITSDQATAAANWHLRCAVAWNEAAGQTFDTFNGERKQLEGMHDRFKSDLQFQQRRILSKAMRLNPNCRAA